MSYIKYRYAGYKTKIKALLRRRISIKRKICNLKINLDKKENVELVELEKEIDKYLTLAGN